MSVTQEDLDLYIALALTQVEDVQKKNFGAKDWLVQEAAIHAMAKQIGREIRQRFQMVPADDVLHSAKVAETPRS